MLVYLLSIGQSIFPSITKKKIFASITLLNIRKDAERWRSLIQRSFWKFWSVWLAASLTFSENADARDLGLMTLLLSSIAKEESKKATGEEKMFAVWCGNATKLLDTINRRKRYGEKTKGRNLFCNNRDGCNAGSINRLFPLTSIVGAWLARSKLDQSLAAQQMEECVNYDYEWCTDGWSSSIYKPCSTGIFGNE